MPARFDNADLPLLERILAWQPDLLVAAVVAKRGARIDSFPIANASGLQALLDGERETFGDQTIARADIPRYVPEEFYPIADEFDLVRKVLVCLRRGRIHHHLQQTAASPLEATRDAGEPVDLLPAPVLPTSLAGFERYLGGL